MDTKKIKLLFLAGSAIFIGAVSTKAYFASTVEITNSRFSTQSATVTASATGTSSQEASATASASASVEPSETPSVTVPRVVLNEFLANLGTDDDAIKPGGEWMELYNNTNNPIDLNGWYLYDEADHALPIILGNVGGDSTIIPAKGFLVVYRNGYSFSLNNGNDTIYLYDGVRSTSNLLDSYHYTGTATNRSTVRLPDGIGGWDEHHDPSPGGPNV